MPLKPPPPGLQSPCRPVCSDPTWSAWSLSPPGCGAARCCTRCTNCRPLVFCRCPPCCTGRRVHCRDRSTARVSSFAFLADEDTVEKLLHSGLAPAPAEVPLQLAGNAFHAVQAVLQVHGSHSLPCRVPGLCGGCTARGASCLNMGLAIPDT